VTSPEYVRLRRVRSGVHAGTESRHGDRSETTRHASGPKGPTHRPRAERAMVLVEALDHFRTAASEDAFIEG